MKLSQVVINMLEVVLKIKKKLKNLLAGVPAVDLPGVHTIQPIAMTLSQVVLNILVVVLEI